MSQRWSNWSGSVTCAPADIDAPAEMAELAALVRAAPEVRVVGTGHSFVPLVATDGVLLNLDRLPVAVEADAARRQAWLPAAWKISALGEPLRAHGLALANQGDIDTQALAGAIGTGTHGTGPSLANLSAMVTGLRLLAPDGSLVQWTDAERLRAARLSLGMFGPIVAVRLRLLPAYRLHERVWREPIAACLARLDARIAATRHFEFFWAPKTDDCLMKSLDPTDATDVQGNGERVDWSHRIFPSLRETRFNECEYCVPAAAGPACFAALRRLMRERFPDVAWPIEYRTLAVILRAETQHGRLRVTVVPITHTSPAHPEDAVEIPAETKRRLRLDEHRSWIVVAEINTFSWPGPDLRPIPGSSGEWAYGSIAGKLFGRIRDGVLSAARRQRLGRVARDK